MARIEPERLSRAFPFALLSLGSPGGETLPCEAWPFVHHKLFCGAPMRGAEVRGEFRDGAVHIKDAEALRPHDGLGIPS